MPLWRIIIYRNIPIAMDRIYIKCATCIIIILWVWTNSGCNEWMHWSVCIRLFWKENVLSWSFWIFYGSNGFFFWIVYIFSASRWRMYSVSFRDGSFLVNSLEFYTAGGWQFSQFLDINCNTKISPKSMQITDCFPQNCVIIAKNGR